MLNIAVLVSGGGTNLQSIIDSIKNGYLKDVNIKYVISDREGTYGIERARAYNIDTLVLDRKIYKKDLSNKIYEVVKDKVDLIVLAGYLSIISSPLIDGFKDRIINIHPSLIPSFCGKGMYGIKIHEAAVDYGVKASGCTVHFVDENTDTGAIILQNVINVKSDDTPEKLQKRILEEEHKALPLAIKLISEHKIVIEDRKVIIKE
ncbi:phosphoribosylglycinamide formyltransferase [uncultured Clostridium sp.]|uniref:phosphoribosylglycinamide formyltransferase n=1 Tax=uncultured Clostridium sp. TaxID=59620 RepID=UPI003216A74F